MKVTDEWKWVLREGAGSCCEAGGCVGVNRGR
jgi:hypothetical protein